GPFTGAISHSMLEALGCVHVLVGHSERRIYFGETDHLLNRKIHAALRGGLQPILCVGEEEDEREAGRYREVLVRQIDRGLEEVSPGFANRLTLAYEPVWAIGTGRAATVEDAVEASQMIRHQLERLLGDKPAAQVRILYGGSVNPANAPGFASRPDVDGVLVGGASLNAADFAAIVRAGW
ncbi:MAG: triose-phosphate isomerase, partial [Acidobacteria bacterium]|nr:triose-phosphate isomerase [Acidobacteriota bacterium]